MVLRETFSNSGIGGVVMFQPHILDILFHKVLEYTNEMLGLSELDNWVFANFHDILASEDAWSIEVAKLIEGSSVEIGEAMTTEEELKKGLLKCLGKDTFPFQAVWGSSSNETLIQNASLNEDSQTVRTEAVLVA